MTENKSEKKKDRMLLLLAVLLVTLLVVIVTLCINYTRKQNETIAYYTQKITALEAELNK